MKVCDTVVTYFTPIPELWDPDSQWKLIDVWRRSWQKAGWNTVVLQEADVCSHPRFDFFYEHFNAKPSEYGHLYTNACWLRWLGAHHYGALRGIPILLSDYDVTNHGLAPLPPWENEMTIFCDEPPMSIFMGAVLGAPQHYLDMCELFAAAKPDDHDWNRHAQLFHQDDLSLLSRLFDTKTLIKPDWLRKRPGCSLFDYSGYRTSKLVHWGYAMKQAGFWPKHAWIEKLRPF
jgi:hypothetical protein